MNAPLGYQGLLAILLASAAIPATAAETPCAPVIESAWVRAAPPGVDSLAGYLTLRNTCQVAVSVTAVESRDFAMAMIHRTEVADGVSRMRPADTLTLEPGQSLQLVPGGMHVMLMQPKKALHEGDTTELVLVLADGRKISSEAPIRRDAL